VYDWPETCLYKNMGAEIPHAIGTITINATYLEGTIERIIWQYLSVDEETAPFITTHLPNNSRAELLLSLIDLHERDMELREAVLHCLKAARRLTDNRNIIVHGLCSPDAGNVIIVKRTARKALSRRTYPLTARNIAEVGLGFRRYFHFATVICEHLIARKKGQFIKLLEAPELPTELISI